jgi:hypothetical protein
MDTVLSVAKTLNGLSLSLDGPPTLVIIKAQFDNHVEYHVERFDYAKDKVIPYPSDLFKIGFLKSTTLALIKDSGAKDSSDRVCKDCKANGISECEHVPTGDWVLGKKESKAKKKEDKKKVTQHKPSKSIDELGYGSAELSLG